MHLLKTVFYLQRKDCCLSLLFLCSILALSLGQTGTQSACYTKIGVAKTCLTYPKHVALNRGVVATDTCGSPSEVSCQIGANTDRCRTCDAASPKNSHPAKYMVDLHNPTNITWWQSTTWWQTNLEGRSTLADPPKVNVTLSFKKLYLVSGGVRITFYTVRPRKMTIQRSIDNGQTWSTYQYFAKSCQTSYGLNADPVITNTNRFSAICTQKFSSELPYVGGVVVFDPRLTRYQNSDYLNPKIQSYLSATDIRLLLEYPGTDGRENINSEATLNQYYYAISDVVVDARCHCHGHAEYCDFINGTELCDCQHFTTGKDCQICLPMYNNRTWLPGNTTNANECQLCQCNGHASLCVFNHTIGFGACQDCQHNTTGPSCEKCTDRFYPNTTKPLNSIDVCIPCDCFRYGITDNGSCSQAENGSSKQIGQCNCKTGVYGRRCDQCVPGKWGFSLPPVGTCFDCICNIFGTSGSNETCNQYTGECPCKSNTQTKTCSECKDTFHSFPTNESADCQPCGCHVAGGFPICNKKTGACLCRRGITGKQCSLLTQGFFFPNFTHVNFEVEMLSQDRNEYFWMLKGYRFDYMGIGQIKLNAGQSIIFTFQVPVTYGYSMVLRYSLFPITWLNTLFLYDAESLTWTGSTSVSTYATSQDRPSLWNVTLNLFGPGNKLVRSSRLSISSLNVGYAKTWNDSHTMQLQGGVNYRLAITYVSVSNAGSQWPMIIDSVLLMPDLTQNSYYSMQLTSVKSEILNCFSQSASLRSAFQLPSSCKQHVFGTNVIMYNGSLACDCFAPGSNDPSNCENYGGQCKCKSGYGGRRCEHCLAGYYGNPSAGCIACGCSTLGSLTPVCNQTNGQCPCKLNAQGGKCFQCKPGQFSLAATNPDGCQSCYGFGHSVSCKEAKRFISSTISSNFTMNRNDGWKLVNESGAALSSGLILSSHGLEFIDEGRQIRYLSAPPRFLGNQLNSYGQRFMIEMKLFSLTETVFSRAWQLRLTGGGMTAVFSLFPRISTKTFTYYFHLHEKFMTNETKLSEFDFKSLLGQLTAIHLSLNLIQGGSGVTIKYIAMTSAMHAPSNGGPFVSHVENATCQTGYEGLSCERCARGYTRRVPNGGPLTDCVPCGCNGRSNNCHPQTGICRDCQTGTTGDHCEKCMPNLMLPNCLSCLPGFWKISPTGCEPCNCYLPGTVNGSSISCDLVTGQCICNSSMNVVGRQCNQCKQNTFNISLGELQCRQCPPCYTPIEQDYIYIRHQNNLLQVELTNLWSNPSFVPKTPLDQSVSTLTVTTNLMTSQALASIPNVTALNALWVSLGAESSALQNALATSTSIAVNNAVSTTMRLLTSYNQSYASVVAISTSVVSSNSQLTTFVANRVAQQETALKQLSTLHNETSVYLTALQTLATQATSIRSTAVAQASQSIQIASVAANDSQTYQAIASSLSTSMTSVRGNALEAQKQGNEVYAFAVDMRNNASSVSAYAAQLQRNITAALPNHSQTIVSVGATTASLQSQIASLNDMIAASTRDINGVEQQISVLKQTDSIRSSQISTTERRLDAVKAKASSASSTSSAAISSALSTEQEAVSILNTVRNFQSVSRQAATDASDALLKINTVLSIAYTASNITSNASTQLIPLQTTTNEVKQFSTEANQIALSEQKIVDSLHSSALKLRANANAALNTIKALQIQQYVDASVRPLLSRCRNYTIESKTLAMRSKIALNQSQLAHTSSQTLSLAIANLATSMNNVPSLDQSKLTPIYENIFRVKEAYSVLGIIADLANLRLGIKRNKAAISSYRSKIDSLKTKINLHKSMYNSLETLTCNVPSEVP